jgi:hypothetical protein
MLPLSGLSPVGGKKVVTQILKFDGVPFRVSLWWPFARQREPVLGGWCRRFRLAGGLWCAVLGRSTRAQPNRLSGLTEA